MANSCPSYITYQNPVIVPRVTKSKDDHTHAIKSGGYTVRLSRMYNNYQDEKVKLYPELHRRILQAQLQRYRQHAITTTEQKRLT